MKKVFVLFAAIVVGQALYGQEVSLKESIEKIVAGKALEIGFAYYDFSNADSQSIDGRKRFPMQSVYKFPIALAMLREVDNRKFALEQQVFISKDDLQPGQWSPIGKRYPEGDVRLPLSEIIEQTVSLSDNVGCDLMLKLLGGAPVVEEYIRSIGITDIAIRNNERELQSSWSVQFDNWTTPHAMIELLKLFDAETLLSADSQAFLWNIMARTSTGSIKDRLPANAIVIHKTGSSGYNAEKVSAATNDVGIMVLPDGRHIAFAIFITNSRESAEVNAGVIAEIGAKLYSL